MNELDDYDDGLSALDKMMADELALAESEFEDAESEFEDAEAEFEDAEAELEAEEAQYKADKIKEDEDNAVALEHLRLFHQNSRGEREYEHPFIDSFEQEYHSA